STKLSSSLMISSEDESLPQTPRPVRCCPRSYRAVSCPGKSSPRFFDDSGLSGGARDVSCSGLQQRDLLNYGPVREWIVPCAGADATSGACGAGHMDVVRRDQYDTRSLEDLRRLREGRDSEHEAHRPLRSRHRRTVSPVQSSPLDTRQGRASNLDSVPPLRQRGRFAGGSCDFGDSASMADVVPGQIIVLNGTSSAGKTSVGRELLDVLSSPFFLMSVDDFGAMRSPTRTAELSEHEVADVLRRTRAGFHRAVAGMAAAGNDVIMDYVFSEAWRLADCVRLF